MIYTNKGTLLATLIVTYTVRLSSNRSWLSTNESAWILNVII
jgi:hypothetical protein